MERGGFHGGYPNLSIANPNPNSNSAAGDQAKATSNGNTAAEENECTVREQDRFMPIANVIRIMRKILPSHAKISDDAKETIQECVSEYISFITGEANERCQREQRKTITAEDVLWAMSKLGFDDYIEPLTLFLHRYREFEGDRGSSSSASIMRADSFAAQVKRAVDYAQPPPHMAFAPLYHHHHHHAFFADAPPMGFFKDLGSNGNVGPSHQADMGNGGDAIGPLGK